MTFGAQTTREVYIITGVPILLTRESGDKPMKLKMVLATRTTAPQNDGAYTTVVGLRLGQNRATALSLRQTRLKKIVPQRCQKGPPHE